jgi:hypothetical protein
MRVNIAGELAERFFGANVEGHEHLYGDSAAAVVEFLDARDLAEEFAIDRAGLVRVGVGDEDAQAFFVFAVFGDEVDAVERCILGGKNLVELVGTGFGRAHANDARKLQTTLASTFFCSRAAHDPL